MTASVLAADAEVKAEPFVRFQRDLERLLRKERARPRPTTHLATRERQDEFVTAVKELFDGRRLTWVSAVTDVDWESIAAKK